MRPRFRFSVCRMMVAVAIVAVALGVLAERRHRYAKIAERLRNELPTSLPIAMSLSYTPGVTERADWIVQMHQKYERAARYPWLPVAPDPPEPK